MGSQPTAQSEPYSERPVRVGVGGTADFKDEQSPRHGPVQRIGLVFSNNTCRYLVRRKPQLTTRDGEVNSRYDG
jgi:hypothetical protein